MRKIKEELQKHTLMLFAGDFARLQELNPDVGAAHIIRTLIRTYLQKIDPPVDVTKVKGDLNV